MFASNFPVAGLRVGYQLVVGHMWMLSHLSELTTASRDVRQRAPSPFSPASATSSASTTTP
jgi:hypothetical protein